VVKGDLVRGSQPINDQNRTPQQSPLHLGLGVVAKFLSLSGELYMASGSQCWLGMLQQEALILAC
jgi:hypothetical protein